MTTITLPNPGPVEIGSFFVGDPFTATATFQDPVADSTTVEEVILQGEQFPLSITIVGGTVTVSGTLIGVFDQTQIEVIDFFDEVNGEKVFKNRINTLYQSLTDVPPKGQPWDDVVAYRNDPRQSIDIIFSVSGFTETTDPLTMLTETEPFTSSFSIEILNNYDIAKDLIASLISGDF